MKGAGYGVLTDILLGVAGAIFGSWVLRVLGIYTSGGLIPTVLVAILGAVLLVVIVRALKRALTAILIRRCRFAPGWSWATASVRSSVTESPSLIAGD
jgi:uncharacterized membrane protein YeaQ/YmgE (transglycosylase-associated protein family)